jgi:hypothetical protein
MLVNGCDCTIVIKTTFHELDVPYSEETLREAISLLQEEAAIEGDGTCKAIQKRNGVIGCVVTPLTIWTAPLLLYLAFGSAGKPVFISGTWSVYSNRHELLPMEDSGTFDLVQDRGGERKLFESCRVNGFELRFNLEEAIRLRLDILGEFPSVIYPYKERTLYQSLNVNDTAKGRERFSGDYVKYLINGKEYKNIYGLTISTKKEGGTKTELWIKRVLSNGSDLPEIIEEIIITGQLLKDKYENRQYGTFRITVKRLVLVSDETSINTADMVIGPLRYYASGIVFAETFSSFEEHYI